MKKKYEIAAIENIQVTLDLSFFDKQEEIYFNATDIARSFEKDIRNWLKLEETTLYCEAVLEERPDLKNSNCGVIPQLENQKQSLKEQNSTILEENPSLNMGISTYLKYGKLIQTARGRYGGTYLHNILAIPFARWCSPQLAFKLDKYLTEKIKDEHLRKEKRLEAKTGFKPMTDAIQQAHEDAKGYHFSNECNMLTKIIKGKNAKQLRIEYNVDDVRRLFNADEMKALVELQEINTSLLKIGMEYEARKEALKKCYDKARSTLIC